MQHQEIVPTYAASISIHIDKLFFRDIGQGLLEKHEQSALPKCLKPNTRKHIQQNIDVE
jgi:hypothetical protein